ncbi:MAG: sugar transporter substrate-binding protein [Herbinix sp.]|jgi:predicted small lipoprotein YifL|nr:sugar transporter substrate-binding protein [Herbinix sp.]
MGNKIKKLLSLMLVLSMVFTLAACGKKEEVKTDDTKTEDTKTETTETDTSGSTTETPAIDTSEHVVVKYVVMGNKPTNGQLELGIEKLNAILTEKLNAELELYWVEWTDWQTQYNLLLASGDPSIDLIGTATDWLDAWPNSKKGAFLELTTEMLQTYAPETFASVSEEHWNMCKLDGKTYLMPEDNYAQWINHGFIYRGDWAKEAGLANGVKSWEDLGTYFAYIKANKTDVIPWDAAASGQAFGQQLTGGYIQSKTGNIFIDGLDVPLFFGASKEDPFTLVSPYMEGDEYVTFAQMMKDWNDGGFWREDVLNYTGDTTEEFYAGQTGAVQHHTQTFVGTSRPTMDTRQPGSEVNFFSFSEESKNLSKVSITHGATAVGANSQHPERALMVYDLLRNNEECYRLLNYGIEGTNYIVTAEGKLDRPEGYDKDTMEFPGFFWWGRNDSLELTNATWYAGKDQVYADYNTYAIDYPYSQLVFNTDDIAPTMANLAEIYTSYVTAIAFGKAGDPAQAVADFRKAMNDAGYEDVKAAIQAQLTEYKAYLGK